MGSRSPSWSALELQTEAGSPPLPNAVITGDRRRLVNLLNLPARTRSLKRVGRGVALPPFSRRRTAAGTTTTSLVRLARRGLAKAERPLGARKMTVLAERLALKFLPRIVSVPPTLTRIGATRVIVGVLPFFLAATAVGAATSRAAAESTSRQMETIRRMPYPLSTVWVAV